MKSQNAIGFIPYEIGDTVKLVQDQNLYVITEIRMTQYVAAKQVFMDVQLRHEKNKLIWRPATIIKERIEQ